MKTTFFEYYDLEDSKIKNIWSNGLFSFDANVLLHLLRFSDAEVEKIFMVFDKIGNRKWLSYQACLEYHKNFRNVMINQIRRYDDALKKLKDFKDFLSNTREHPFIEGYQRQISSIEKKINRSKSELKEKQQKFIQCDRICKLFDGFVSQELDKNTLDRIYREGENRYKNQIPPGYKDAKKPFPECYGDLVLWNELIIKSKEINKDIIFITDDNKEDWFKDKEVRCELRREFYQKTNRHILIYTLSSFLKESKLLDDNIQNKDLTKIQKIIEKYTRTESGEGNSTLKSGFLRELFDSIDDDRNNSTTIN